MDTMEEVEGFVGDETGFETELDRMDEAEMLEEGVVEGEFVVGVFVEDNAGEEVVGEVEGVELIGDGLTTTVDDRTIVLEYEELGLGLTMTVDWTTVVLE